MDPTSFLPVSLSNNSSGSPESFQDAASEFMKFREILADRYEEWTRLPEDQRLRHKYLNDHGLSEQDLDNLPPDDKAAHEEKISEIIKQPVFQNTADVNATGDTVSRPVLSLQSVLKISTPHDTQGDT